MELPNRLRVRRKILLAATLQLIAAAFSVVIFLAPNTSDAATVPYLINFQGRIADNSGNILANGSYNMKFRLWNAVTGGTNEWEADRVYGTSDYRVSVVNGLFNIQLGDTTKGDTALTAALFDTYTEGNLYLEVELPTPTTSTCATNGCAVWTEGAMTPRQPLASSPYAINADNLDGLNSTAFTQVATTNNFSATNTFSAAAAAGVVLSGSPASGGSLLQVGSTLFSGNTSGTLIGANGTFSGDILNLQVANTTKLKVDNSGNLTLASGAVMTIGSTAGVATTCTGNTFLQNQVVTGGIVTGGTCVAAQAAGNYLVQAPSSSSTNTINPTGATTGLTVNGSSTATVAVSISQAQAADAEDILFSSATNNALGITANALTTGTGLSVASSSAGLTTGSLISVSSATIGAVNTNGIVSLQATGNYTSTNNNGLLDVLANATTAGTAALISGNALTSGTGLAISANALTTGQALNLTSTETTALTTGALLGIIANSATTPTSGLLQVQANALTTGVAVGIGSTNLTLTTGTLLKVASSTTGAINTNGIVSLQASGNYTSTANNGLLDVLANATTAGTVELVSGNALTTGSGIAVTANALTTGQAVNLTSTETTALTTGSLLGITANTASTPTNGLFQIQANGLTTGIAANISSTSGTLTTGSLIKVSSSTTGAINTNGIVSLQASGNYTSTSNNGLLDVLANATTAGTAALISGTAITTGTGLDINTPAITTGSALTIAAGTGAAVTAIGKESQTYSTAVAGAANTVTVTNTNAGAGVAVQGISITPSNASASSGTNTLYGVNFTAGTLGGSNATTNGINFASTTGYTNFINSPSAVLTSGGAFTGLTGVALSSGNVSTPGTISTSGTGTIVSAGTITVGSFATATSTPVCSNGGVLSTCNALPSSTSLQQAYANGNTISTSGTDIADTLNSSNNFSVSETGTGTTEFEMATDTTPPAELVLVRNNDTADRAPLGVSVTSAAGGITTAFDASSANITNALAIGSNAIAGTNFSVTGAGAVTAVGVNAGSGSIQGTGGVAITGASTIAGTLGSVTNLTLSGSISGGTTFTGSGNINTTAGTIQTNSTTRIDNAGDLTNIGTIATSGAINGATIGAASAFATSVTSPIYTSTGSLSIQPASGSNLSLTGTGASALNLTTATGNVSLSTGGASAGVLVDPTTNSTTAFEVQNASSVPIFVVDTSTSMSNNYFVNGGFEIGTTTPSDWASVGSPVPYARNTTAPYHYGGQASLELGTTAASQGFITTGAGSFHSTPPSGVSTVSFYAEVTTGSLTSANLETVVNGGTAVACNSGVTLNGSGFQRVICPINPAASITSVAIETANSGTRTFYVDSVQLVSGANAAPASSDGTIQLRGAVDSPADFQSLSNSTTAFQIQNTAGTSNLLDADTLNGRIGIGTQTPGYTLDVAGTANATAYDIGGVGGAAATVSCGANQAVTTATFTSGLLTTAPTCNTIAGTGANTTLSNLGTTSINAALLPSGTVALGSTALAWSNVYSANFDTGSGTPALTIGNNNATSIVIGKAAFAVSIPGGLTTSGGTINTAAGSISTTGAVNAGTVVATTSVSSPSYTGGGAVTLQAASGSALGLTASGVGAINVTTGTGALNITAGGNVATTIAAGTSATYTNNAVMTTDQIDQTDSLAADAPTTDGINLLQQTFYAKPATGATESSTRINVTDSNAAAGGQVNGLRIVATGAGGAINSTTDGIYIDPLANSSTGATENALQIQSGWDNILEYNGTTTIVNGTGLVNASQLGQGSAAVTLQSAAATALTITGNAASTWSTSAGQLTVQSGSGTVSLGTSTILTANAALTVEATGSNALTLAAGGTASNVDINPTTTGTVVVGGFTPTVSSASSLTLQSTAAALTLNATGAGAIDITPGTGGIVNTITPASDDTFNEAATAVQSADQIDQSNVSADAPTGTGVNLLQQTFYGAATTGNEQSSTRINVTNNNTVTSGQVNGLRIVATGPGGAVNSITDGIAIDPLANVTTGATQSAIQIGANWTDGLSIASGGNTIAATSATALVVQNAGSLTEFSVDASANNTVHVGSATSDANEVLLQLDSYNAFADAGTCAAATQGALYYNTVTNAIRSCVNSNWEDVVTTSGLGIIMYGVVPDGPTTTGLGDLAGANGYNSGPCKVYLTATANIIGWNSCTAYSGGRKVLVTAGTVAVNGTASVYQNLCLTGANSQPALFGTANASETTVGLFPTFTVGSPILCLAEIKTATTAGKVADIYDTRAYTTDTKTFATIATTTLALGSMVTIGAAIGEYTPTAATTSPLAGVVVAYSGTLSTTLPNAVMVTAGPIAIKNNATGTLGQIIEYGALAGGVGYSTTIADPATTAQPYMYAGVALNAYSGVAAGCTVSTVCNGSTFTNLTIR
jgi:hypothetical protein